MSSIKYGSLKQVMKADVPRQTLLNATDMYGYGIKIPIGYKVKIESSSRWLRVYMVFTSNSPTYYVSTKSSSFIVLEYSDIVDRFVKQHRYDYWNATRS